MSNYIKERLGDENMRFRRLELWMYGNNIFDERG